MDPIKIPKLTESQIRMRLQNAKLGENELVMAALEQANLSHKDQKRDDGSSYLEQHIYPVCAVLLDYYEAKRKSPTGELIAASLLHDVLEDDPTLDETKFKEKFGETVYSYVKPLTKHPDAYLQYPGDTKQDKKLAYARDYISSLDVAPAEAKLIKLSDRLNNITCLHATGSKEKYLRYLKETERLYLPFAKKRSSYFYGKIKSMLELQKKTNFN